MSNLSHKSKAIIDELFVNSGYVLDFSNSSFQIFVSNSVNIDIYDSLNYQEYCSKANKLRQILNTESNEIVSKLLKDMIDYFEDHMLKHNEQMSPYQQKKIVELKKEIEYLSRSSSIILGQNLSEKIQMISTRNAHFFEMSLNEKLKEIVNLIENLLKVNSGYLSIDYAASSFGLVNENMVKHYRRNLQCFRHSTEESMIERSKFSDNEKKFLVDFGICLCNLIYETKNHSKS